MGCEDTAPCTSPVGEGGDEEISSKEVSVDGPRKLGNIIYICWEKIILQADNSVTLWVRYHTSFLECEHCGSGIRAFLRDHVRSKDVSQGGNPLFSFSANVLNMLVRSATSCVFKFQVTTPWWVSKWVLGVITSIIFIWNKRKEYIQIGKNGHITKIRVGSTCWALPLWWQIPPWVGLVWLSKQNRHKYWVSAAHYSRCMGHTVEVPAFKEIVV